jgi:hypothetical protein
MYGNFTVRLVTVFGHERGDKRGEDVRRRGTKRGTGKKLGGRRGIMYHISPREWGDKFTQVITIVSKIYPCCN